MGNKTSSATAAELVAESTWLNAFARALVTEPSAADDAVQDTYQAALESPPRGERPLRPWLATVLRNFVRRQWRAQRRRSTREQQAMALAAEPLPSPETLLANHHARRLVAEAVAQLAEPYRSTVLLVYAEGLTPAEVARRQGIGSGTVRWRLKRGLDQVRAALDERHGGDRRSWRLLLSPLAAAGAGVPAGPDELTTELAPHRESRRAGQAIAASALAVVVVIAAAVSFFAGRPGDRRAPGGSAPAATAEAQRRHLANRPVAVGQRPSELPRLVGATAATPPTAAIEGTVRDGSGTPVAGVRLGLFARFPPIQLGAGRNLAPVAVATSGRDGRYRIDAVPAGNYGLTATGAEHAPAHRGPLTVVAGGTLRAVDVTVRPWVDRLSGRITDADGNPVVGARVLLADDEFERNTLATADTSRMFVTFSDGQGRYRAGFHRAPTLIMVSADGYADHAITVGNLIGELTRDFVLEPAVALSGRVVRRGSQEPVAGAVLSYAGHNLPFAVTDESGSFTASRLKRGPNRFQARRGNLVGTVTVNVEPPGSAGVVLVVDAARVVTGRVVSAEGAPITGTDLWLIDSRGSWSKSPENQSGADGRFVLEAVAPGKYQLSGMAPGLVAQAPTPVDVESADAHGVTLVLSPGGVVAGTVLTSDGRPAARVEVMVHNWHPTRKPSGWPERLRTGGDGTFRSRPMLEGTALVVAEDALRGVGHARSLAVKTGQTISTTIRLERGATVSGRVRWDDGTPAAAAVVRAVQGWSGFTGLARTATTDADGRFTFSHLLNAQLWLAAGAAEPPPEPWGRTPSADATSLKLVGGHPATAEPVELTLARPK